MVLKPECVSKSLGGLVKLQITRAYSLVFVLVGLGKGPIICISNMFPGDVYATGPGTTPENHEI